MIGQYSFVVIKTAGICYFTNSISGEFFFSDVPGQDMYKDLGNPKNLDFFHLVPE